jgi:hypothetical protein
LDDDPLRIFLPEEAQKVCSRLATRNRNSGQTMAFFNMQIMEWLLVADSVEKVFFG